MNQKHYNGVSISTGGIGADRVDGRRVLPLAMQTFRTVRDSGAYYVDKTEFAHRMITEGRCYFLSRPRRFGKSLFVDTLKELFEGNEKLFQSLFIHNRWDWSERCPVVRLDFSGRHFATSDGLKANVRAQLFGIERRIGINTDYVDLPETERLTLLLEELHRCFGKRVVVLVDEYDKPILDAIKNPDLAQANRDFLRGLYGCLKFADAHIRFVFLTGVSKFSKVSLFSGLNNLEDITLDPVYSSICGFTEAELDQVFDKELEGLDRKQVREWYNGYNWLGSEKIYNPYDVLLLFKKREFDAYWFETATPKFLVDILLERDISLDQLSWTVDKDTLLASFDVENMPIEALLFQTGYLTITGIHGKHLDKSYNLDYPNREVRQSLNKAMLRSKVGTKPVYTVKRAPLRQLLDDVDAEGLRKLFSSFFEKIPYSLDTERKAAHYESYYVSIFYAYFNACGFDARLEVATSHGRTDMVVHTSQAIWLFEFKMINTPTPNTSASVESVAMQQLIQREYAKAYYYEQLPIHLTGIEISRKTHNITSLNIITIQP